MLESPANGWLQPNNSRILIAKSWKKTTNQNYQIPALKSGNAGI